MHVQLQCRKNFTSLYTWRARLCLSNAICKKINASSRLTAPASPQDCLKIVFIAFQAYWISERLLNDLLWVQRIFAALFKSHKNINETNESKFNVFAKFKPAQQSHGRPDVSFDVSQTRRHNEARYMLLKRRHMSRWFAYDALWVNVFSSGSSLLSFRHLLKFYVKFLEKSRKSFSWRSTSRRQHDSKIYYIIRQIHRQFMLATSLVWVRCLYFLSLDLCFYVVRWVFWRRFHASEWERGKEVHWTWSTLNLKGINPICKHNFYRSEKIFLQDFYDFSLSASWELRKLNRIWTKQGWFFLLWLMQCEFEIYEHFRATFWIVNKSEVGCRGDPIGKRY